MYIFGTVLFFIGLGAIGIAVLFALVMLVGDLTGWYEIEFPGWEDVSYLPCLLVIIFALIPFFAGSFIRDPYIPKHYTVVTTHDAVYDHVMEFRTATDSHPYFSGKVDGKEMIFTDIVMYEESPDTYVPREL